MRVPAEIAEFLKLVGGFVATRDAENRPIACEGAVVAVDPETGIAEIAANVRFARNLVENLADNGRFAYGGTRPWGDHRSVQLKGRCLEVRGPFRDPTRVAPSLDHMAQMLDSFGVPPKVAEDFSSLRHDHYYNLRVQIEEIYDQTPGPGAGRAIT